MTRWSSPGSTTTPTSGRGCRRPGGPGPACGGPRWKAETGELPAAQYDHLLSGRTRLVAVTAASNVLGTRPDVAAITAKAHHAARSLPMWTACTPHRMGPSTSPRSAPTSSPRARTSGPARMSAPSSPTLACSTACTRTSSRPRPARCPSGSRPVPRRTPTWPESPPRSITSRHSTAPPQARAVTRLLASMAAAEAHENRLFQLLLGRARVHAPRHLLREGGQPDRHRVLHRGRPHPA